MLGAETIQWFIDNTVLGKACHKLYVVLLVYPMHEVYTRAYWSGLPVSDICSALTRHRSDFWREHADECLVIITNNLDAWLVYFHFSLYLVIVYLGLRRMCC